MRLARPAVQRPPAVRGRLQRVAGVGHKRQVVARGGFYVPSDSFGGLSPEKKAANSLRALFTFIACRVILAQLEGSGRGALGAYNAAAYTLLSERLQGGGAGQISRDPDAWLEGVLEEDPALGLRVLEVRDAYCREGFEWDQLQRLAVRDTKEANLQLMRRAAGASLRAVAAEPAAAGGGGGGGGEQGGGGGGEQGDSGGGGGGGGGGDFQQPGEGSGAP
ncbi:hypothetical protein Rsub_00795 [Raphidocelis subcapitata]|uniref:Uncharacterized protein n=1 Tax=Raphidocelis subcapitata TaxID=307507 RepID=A0A2V0NRA2_9CHLO|nr:hypothetical protein Rsub_00795 [Raphidocelis subcapitata]|eukprot:GBF88083.1 hypothetical protein Rsub_00795 [Raphidocelis subcapitata]